MQVLVRDRRELKTTELVRWLLRGKTIPNYPGWSRVIVCATSKQVLHVTDMVKQATAYHLVNGIEFPGIHSLRKAVWGVRDLRHNMRGAHRGFEYAIDDIDMFLEAFLDVQVGPAVVTITGEHVDNVRD